MNNRLTLIIPSGLLKLQRVNHCHVKTGIPGAVSMSKAKWHSCWYIKTCAVRRTVTLENPDWLQTYSYILCDCFLKMSPVTVAGTELVLCFCLCDEWVEALLDHLSRNNFGNVSGVSNGPFHHMTLCLSKKKGSIALLQKRERKQIQGRLCPYSNTKGNKSAHLVRSYDQHPMITSQEDCKGHKLFFGWVPETEGFYKPWDSVYNEKKTANEISIILPSYSFWRQEGKFSLP